MAVLLAAGWLSRRLAAGLLAVWLPAVVWAAGAPVGQLLPPAWPWLVVRLMGGVGRLAALGSATGPIGDDPWSLAAWLLGAGVLWVAGTVVAASGPSARRRAIAFGLLTAPWIAAVAVRQTDGAAWQGAAVLLAGLLWFADRRGPCGRRWRWAWPPRWCRCDTYQVRARLVRATAEQLQAAPPPTDGGLSTSMDVYVPAPGNSWRLVEVKVPLFGQPPDLQVTAVLDRTPYGPVAALARQLAAGADTQWDVVARVQRYLLDGGRFRYTTNPPQAGPYPLVDFLLRGHVGYCQHFAGAGRCCCAWPASQPGW